MLNELLIVERAARAAGILMPEDHPDVKDCRKTATLLVQLDEKGGVAAVRPLPAEVDAWKICDGQQNSFPFVQDAPLALRPSGDERDRLAEEAKDRRAALLALAEAVGLTATRDDSWPKEGLLRRLRERRQDLVELSGTDASVVLATLDRFLLACGAKGGGRLLLDAVTQRLVAELRQTAADDWVAVADALLWGKKKKGEAAWESEGALLLEAHGAEARIFDLRVRARVSAALIRGTEAQDIGLCALTGDSVVLLSGTFPQPNVPLLGQTFLFAKNRDTPASYRYGRHSAEAMPVGSRTANRLAAALKALTAEERKGKTWRAIPSEAPKKSRDLMLAFVEVALEAPVAEALADDFSEEEPPGAASGWHSVGAFEKRTERVIEAVRAMVSGDFRQTPVNVMVLRAVDPANRKVTYAGAPTVGDLYDAAAEWAAGERNLPEWLALPGRGRAREWVALRPPHIAPLGVISFSRSAFTHCGAKCQEVVGVPAGEALSLFLDGARGAGSRAARRGQRVLRTVLARRQDLVIGAAHAQRRGSGPKADFDARETLRTATMLGLLLHKLGRLKEGYMSDTAFKLGQLLAAADVVHAGYCADVRDGALPPSLLGNQIFTMAQSSPTKALAVLCRRWKPYGGWAMKAARQPERATKLVESKDRKAQERGWDIRKALSHARRAGQLADELATSLEGCQPDDTYRAELLLGYLAGLPRAHDHDADVAAATTTADEQEE